MYHDAMESKAAVRKRLLRRRRHMSAREVQRVSDVVARQVLQAVDWSKVRQVHIYTKLPGENEIDTAPLERLLGEHFPAIRIEKGMPAKSPPEPKGAYDVVIVPLVGFDARGHRLGFGSGWYDRFLAAQPQAKKIGLAYSWAEVEHLPNEAHDVPLDGVIAA